MSRNLYLLGYRSMLVWWLSKRQEEPPDLESLSRPERNVWLRGRSAALEAVKELGAEWAQRLLFEIWGVELEIRRFRDFKPGARVAYNARFLRNTGQTTFKDGEKGYSSSNPFIVLECECEFCARGSHVAVNVLSEWEFSAEEKDDAPGRVLTHIDKENLYVLGDADHRNSPSSNETTLKTFR